MEMLNNEFSEWIVCLRLKVFPKKRKKKKREEKNKNKFEWIIIIIIPRGFSLVIK